MRNHLVILATLCLLAPFAEGRGQRLIDPVAQEVAAAKPTAADTADQAREKCERLSERSKRLGLKTLIIGFEGLGSFNAALTQAAYQSHWQRTEGAAVTAPSGGGSGGYLLRGMLLPLLEAHGSQIEFLDFPHDSQQAAGTSNAEVCATVWMRQPGRRLLVTGHSYGGHAANQLAEALERAKVTIETVVTVDARTRMYVGDLHKTSNVGTWANFYQRNTPFLPGYVVDGADLNMNLSTTGVQHGGIPAAPAVREFLETLF